MKITGKRLSNFIRKGHTKDKRNSDSGLLEKAGMPSSTASSVVANNGAEQFPSPSSSKLSLPSNSQQNKPSIDSIEQASDSNQRLVHRRATTIGALTLKHKSDIRRASSPVEPKPNQLTTTNTVVASERRHSFVPLPASPSHSSGFFASSSSGRADWHQYYSSRHRRHSASAIMRWDLKLVIILIQIYRRPLMWIDNVFVSCNPLFRLFTVCIPRSSPSSSVFTRAEDQQHVRIFCNNFKLDFNCWTHSLILFLLVFRSIGSPLFIEFKMSI